MTDDKKIKTLNVFKELIEVLRKTGFKFIEERDGLSVYFSVDADDIQINHVISVDEEMQVLRYYSPIPFEVSKDRLADVSLAVAITNNLLKTGYFDFDLAERMITFKITSSFLGSLIGKEFFGQMIAIARFTVDEYNDKLKELNDGKITINDYLDFIYKE